MSQLIQWPRAKYWDKPWNPVIGCKPVSPGCANCYARALVTGRWNLTGIWSPDFTPTFKPTSKIPKHGVIFCGNMTDLFGEWVRTMQIFDWFSEMWTHGKCGPEPNPATYLWLTKRAGRLGDCVSDYTECPNAYFGVTAESSGWFEKRMYALASSCADIKKARWWLSCEPLLGPICLAPWTRLFGWVVVGCESGPRRRPCKVEWVESIVEECRNAGVPVFVKQLDIGGRCVTDIEKFPEHLRIRQCPGRRRERSRYAGE